MSLNLFLISNPCLGDDESVIILWQLKPTQPGESAAPRLFDDDAGENKAGFLFYSCINMKAASYFYFRFPYPFIFSIYFPMCFSLIISFCYRYT